MEPVTILVMMLIVLVMGGGTTGQVVKRRRKRRKEELREVLLKKFPAPDRYLSIFDLFWDLGVSDFALVIMGHQDLLPRNPEDVDDIFRRLDDRIQAHGSYQAFVDDVLEAIQEFYEEHRRAGERRALPTLDLPAVKMLPLPDHSSPSAPTPPGGTPPEGASHEEDGLPDGYILDLNFEERTQARESRSTTASSALIPVSTGQSVDIDDLLRAGPLDILKGLMQGNFAQRLSRWVQLRQLRQLRAELDQKLVALFRYFDGLSKRDPDFFSPLYDLTRRWERELMRIERLERERPWSERPFAQSCDLLVEEAKIFARYLARHAKQNTDEAIASIGKAAVKGDEAMAGYLIYANRYAFFAGRGDNHARLVSEIEYAASRIQNELRNLQQQDML